MTEDKEKTKVPKAKQTDAQAAGEYMLNLGILCVLGILFAIFVL